MRETCRDDAEHIDYPIQILRGQAQLKKEHGDADKDQVRCNYRARAAMVFQVTLRVTVAGIGEWQARAALRIDARLRVQL